VAAFGRKPLNFRIPSRLAATLARIFHTRVKRLTGCRATLPRSQGSVSQTARQETAMEKHGSPLASLMKKETTAKGK